MNNFFFVALYPYIYVISKSKFEEVGKEAYKYQISPEISIIFLNLKKKGGLCFYLLMCQNKLYSSQHYMKNVFYNNSNIILKTDDRKISTIDAYDLGFDEIIREKLKNDTLWSYENFGLKYEIIDSSPFMYLSSLSANDKFRQKSINFSC